MLGWTHAYNWAKVNPHLQLGPRVSSDQGWSRQCFFFQFADGVRVSSIPRQIQTDFVKLATLFSGGRPEGSRRNLNFQSATWHHLKHFQRKAEGD
jgi:hypothetical protein